LLSALQAVEAVRAVEKARTRISPKLSGPTYFGDNDAWLYQESGHPNICEECSSYNLNVYRGSEIRQLFPYLEIINKDFIAVHIHPHCGCMLVRVYPVELEEEPVGTRQGPVKPAVGWLSEAAVAALLAPLPFDGSLEVLASLLAVGQISPVVYDLFVSRLKKEEKKDKTKGG
jgi:hypothetical protein